MGSGLPGFGRGFTCPVLLGIPMGRTRDFAYGAFTRSGPSFQRVRLSLPVPCLGPATPEGKPSGLGCCAFARRYWRNRVCFLLLEVLRCFTSLRVALPGLSWFIPERRPSRGVGFPHSEIPGSKPFGGSPGPIAALCVLHHLMMPRHPSHARIRLARDLAISLRCNSLQLPARRFSKIDTKRCFRGFPPPGGPVVEVAGFEPAASCLQSRHSTS